MKFGTLLVAFVFSCLSLVSGVDGQTLKLDAPEKWRSESVKLPPPFAPKVSLKGEAKVYFSPGWGKKDSDEFFTYIFLFQTEAEPKFDEKVIEKELLAYFGGLAAAVSRGKVDPKTFKMTVKEMKQDSEKKGEADSKRYSAQMKWTEPFFTKAEQTLHLEVVAQFNTEDKKNYLVVGASPQDPRSRSLASSKVWQQLRKVQTDFNSKAKKTEKAPEKQPSK